MNITEAYLETLKANKFGVIKYGEDACFNLEEYNLKGGSVAKVRAAINHANKDGITVPEYKPVEEYNRETEKAIQSISKEWMAGKNMPEMKFMLGGTGLESPETGSDNTSAAQGCYRRWSQHL